MCLFFREKFLNFFHIKCTFCTFRVYCTIQKHKEHQPPFYQEDFFVTVEWHNYLFIYLFFFATMHGEGPSGGVSGTVKRLARFASLK